MDERVTMYQAADSIPLNSREVLTVDTQGQFRVAFVVYRGGQPEWSCDQQVVAWMEKPVYEQ